MKYRRKIIAFLQAIFTVLAFSTADYVITSDMVYDISENANFLMVNLAKLKLNYANAFGIESAVFCGTLGLFYYYVSEKHMEEGLQSRLQKIYVNVFSGIFTFFMVFGYSYIKLDSWDLILSGKFQILISLINSIGFFCLWKNILDFLVIKIVQMKWKEWKIPAKFKLIKEHRIIGCFAFLIICWLPYIIIYYPGTLNSDALFQILQFYGDIPWTTHHPILPTILYGLFMKLGTAIVNNNFGIFLNNFLQLLCAAYLLSYSIKYLCQYCRNDLIAVILLAYFSLLPIWPINFYTECKDSWFILAFLFYIILLIKLVVKKGYETKREWISLFFSMIFVYLFRNNGSFIILLTMPFVVIGIKECRKKIVISTVATIMICVLFNTTLMKTLKIEKGSKGEILSIPLQQTARYVKEYELEEQEIKVIEKVVAIEDIKTYYQTETVDFVKACYKNPTNEELKEYFKIWFTMFLKHPTTYIQATMNATYGYFYPDRTEYKDGIAMFELNAWENLNHGKFDIHFAIDKENQIRGTIESYAYMLRDIPIIGLLYSCGTYTWLLLVTTFLCLYFKRYKELLIQIPLYVVVLVCVASPVNAFVRYVQPLMISMPFILMWTIFNIKNKGDTSG